MNIHFLIAGSCYGDNSHVYVNAPKGKTIFPASFAYIDHPTLGHILFDTGYSEHFFTSTDSFPNNIYRLITPVDYSQEKSAKHQLDIQFGLNSDDIDYIIVSHFHGDHIAGLKDFNSAKFIFSKRAVEHFNKTPRYRAFSKGYLKGLLPDNFDQRCIYIEDEFEKIEQPFFKNAWSWKEAEIKFVDLPGHSRGQIGIRLNAMLGSNKTELFLVSDAAWSISNITLNLPPAPIVKLFVDDYSALKATINNLNKLYRTEPNVHFIVTHCKETLFKYI